jgi:hypothetical protein
MQWQQLYSAQRTGSAPKTDAPGETARTSFIRDYDRLIFSSAFRRLQNKTQVFPLPGAVFVHNRLTHSLEVASVGRSLGKAVGDQLALQYGEVVDGFTEFYKYELPNHQIKNNYIKWKWNRINPDWNTWYYPFSLDGNIYRTWMIHYIIKRITIKRITIETFCLQ